ncbi:tRNA (N6-threonylcarbamoyladenosine(37)-N6)-methyltransferase TrmO [Rhodoligotrophos appendicifer]|uniref:tRNA (N6-threonylcarbamoyladenosine(37)-N6)-methyltransferase TrmO n=1 Tax=Rhodoligotrophos appendicifer TaxID=987056 RepID=UPI001185E9E3|nr:tRNA (N6-threonylcarbamoyladenosine(37)-N6)-methyltransferase TrmO [Rhodoligotrophos appendicifer]
MDRSDDLRDGEQSVPMPRCMDAGLIFIGRITTPWRARAECPRQGDPAGPLCQVEIFDPWQIALRGLENFEWIELLYWLHFSRRDIVLQTPRHDATTRGTFSLRSPVRPNPIGTSRVRLEAVEGRTLLVRGLDCLDGTPLLDVKPDRCAFSHAGVDTR